MSAAFTPGHWKFRSERTRISIWSPRYAVAYLSYTRPEREANANLIAAAPALYEALTPIAAACDQYVAEWRSDDVPVPVYIKASDLRRARAALKQARGEQ